MVSDLTRSFDVTPAQTSLFLQYKAALLARYCLGQLDQLQARGHGETYRPQCRTPFTGIIKLDLRDG